jgi:hypothetical protein
MTTTHGPLPELITAAGYNAGMRFLEFFAARIRNPKTRSQASANSAMNRRGSLGRRGRAFGGQ